MIQAEGYPLPVPIAVGINDAAQLFHAAGAPTAAAVPGPGQAGGPGDARHCHAAPLLPTTLRWWPSGCVGLPVATCLASPCMSLLSWRQLAPATWPAGPEFRRPSTMALWARSLEAAGAQVDRVLITRLGG